MATIRELIAQGKAEGKAEGEAEGFLEGYPIGLWMGRLQAVQELMSLPVTPESELADMTAAELEQRFLALQRRYESQFKLR
ncbi:MAG: hypothetical protein ACKVY0_04425 [Prosthecobacter sp.]|uniref:hypothetical protein n=1 Tax=Prosthecobacter sp. TaxID=1965333 RepID=UPI00390004A2